MIQPLIMGVAYLVATFLLFLFGPIDYPKTNIAVVSVYFALCMAAIIFPYYFAARQRPRTSSLTNQRTIYVAGSIFGAILLIPSTYIYTGHFPWDIAGALGDQHAAYLALQDQILATEGRRGPIVLARMVLQPLIFAVVPLGVLYWRKMSWPMRLWLFVAIGCDLIFSILRGTDREVADLIVISVAAFLIGAARRRLRQPRPPQKGYRARLRASGPALLVLLAVVLALALQVFMERRQDRLVHLGEYCFGQSNACANYKSPLVAALPDRDRFGVTMAAGYASGGYYGLSLALKKDFRSTYGLGHSPALMRVYEALTNDHSLETKTFNSRNAAEGWPGEFFWSTMMTSLANDVGFPVAVVLLGFFGWVWGRSFLDAVVGGNDPAAIVFCICALTVVYFPANLQMLLGLDGYSTCVVWLAVWMFTNRAPVPIGRTA
jgi:hypothetical protein